MTTRTKHFVALAFVAAALSVCASAQDKTHSLVAQAATAKFGSLPVLPSCATFTVDRGDPMKEAAILLIKAATGCVIPWHWHSATEQLLIVSGTSKVEMKDENAALMKKGDYALLPAKHPHQFTCQAECVFFVDTDGAFDIHYLDKSGKEIPVDEALNAVKEQPGK